MVDLNADRFFVTWVTCHSCGKRIELYKPSHKIFDIDAFCTKCKEQNLLKDKLNTSVRAEKEFVSEFSLEQSENRLLEMSLRELGIPLWHVIPVRDKNGNYQYYEISGDKHEVIPNIISKVDKEIHIE